MYEKYYQLKKSPFRANPDPASELQYSSVFELLAAVLLSAQATDVGVNKATATVTLTVTSYVAAAGVQVGDPLFTRSASIPPGWSAPSPARSSPGACTG